MKFWIVLVVLLLTPVAAKAEEPVVSQSQILAWMQQLRPLTKVHYSWPIQFNNVPDQLLFEYVRLTHAASISGEWCKQKTIDQAVELCHRVNASNPETPASIGVNFSVWHRRFGKELPPTDFGPSHRAELQYLRKRMNFVRNGVGSANRRHNSKVKVTAILFDSERFHAKKSDSEWNAAITKKHDAAYDIVRSVFPKARIEWYARGGVSCGASKTGWAKTSYLTLDEKGDAFACSLYRVPEIEVTRGTFRRTAARAAEHNCQAVTPWIALASGYRRQTTKYHQWSFDWNYDLIYSWKLGKEMHHPWYSKEELTERFAPWSKAKVAVFYPAPFYTKSPHWGQHFVAYVRGANGYSELPEVEPEVIQAKKPKKAIERVR